VRKTCLPIEVEQRRTIKSIKDVGGREKVGSTFYELPDEIVMGKEGSRTLLTKLQRYVLREPRKGREVKTR